MNSFVSKFARRLSFDSVMGGTVATIGTVVLMEAYFRTDLGDAETSKACRYPPTSTILTKDHIRELERNNMVVIHNVLTPTMLQGARNSIQKMGKIFDSDNHSNDEDVRRDATCVIRESDAKFQHGHDSLIHCIKLLRGVPYLLDRFQYNVSSSFNVPKQCQLSRYISDGQLYGYKRHLDRCTESLSEMGLLGWLRASDYRHRSVTCILYLNSPDWNSGGNLRCYRGKETVEERETFTDVNPTGGTLIIFDSEKVEHEVLPSTKDRYALTLWINGERKEVIDT
ncbi:hypothetical protein CTEN210_08949 [Chaetoceros tenuissimus]|uniref:Fe2OG dioxygenase domain-containing protein n=1 Tax=Chaetoceros tenuissimus TaxID=426638 RepID=A0AAD3H753_9STRA|nr:hypothetical protein CTEN210_08949 [Chaetoceros tenuissimus]